MLSKYKRELGALQTSSYYPNFDLSSIKYDKEDFVPKKSFYKQYFEQNRRGMPLRLLFLTFSSYAGGCFFGVIMLAFSFMGTGGMYVGVEDKNVKYKNFKEVIQSAKKTLKNSVHRNGVFVIRFSFAIALFNLIVTYLPLYKSRFGDLYGFGHFETLVNFLTPMYILTKFTNVAITTRLLYSIGLIYIFRPKGGRKLLE